MYNQHCKATPGFASLKHTTKFLTLQVCMTSTLHKPHETSSKLNIYLTKFLPYAGKCSLWVHFHKWTSFCIKVLMCHSYKSKALIVPLLWKLFFVEMAMKCQIQEEYCKPGNMVIMGHGMYGSKCVLTVGDFV